MKQYRIKISFLLLGIVCIFTSCRDDLLNQPSRSELPATAFWKTTTDAEYALNGMLADVRYLFSRDYYLDGRSDLLFSNGSSTGGGNPDVLSAGAAYRGCYEFRPVGYGTQADKMYEHCYGGVNRANYVIDGVEKMVEKETHAATKTKLESIIGEAKLLRCLVYFRLISWWGDVPYIDQRIYSDAEVSNLSRTPIAKIVPKLLEDLTYAYAKLPEKAPGGRMAKPAALALRGKIQLYWACWNKFGWPELDTFTPDPAEADKAYKAAAADFKSVINDFGLTLYKNGDPGECDELGKAEKLPNYYYLFTPLANGDPEFILAFNFGGSGTGQSEELVRDFGGRSVEDSQAWLHPRSEIANRYQSVITGDFCPPLQPGNPSDPRTIENSALNPQSYANRDYRMKASILWDYEMFVGLSGLQATGWVPYIYKSVSSKVTIDGVEYTTSASIGKTGYLFRKFVRNYPGQARSSGNYNWPVIRLADVYLMYAEAVNEAGIAAERGDAIECVNRVRRRGNLPPLAASKTASYNDFFAAIEQERMVELLAEGHRNADLRRWRAIERVFVGPGDPNGIRFKDTYGNDVSDNSGSVFFQNQTPLTYERCYIFRIPPAERDRNPNLTQNKPFL